MRTKTSKNQRREGSSFVQVAVGKDVCRLTAANETTIECVVGPATRGEGPVYPVSVIIPPLGLADCNATVVRDFVITSLHPSNGSLAGRLYAYCGTPTTHCTQYFSSWWTAQIQSTNLQDLKPTPLKASFSCGQHAEYASISLSCIHQKSSIQVSLLSYN